MLDFGPAFVDGWLADLVGSQIVVCEPEVVSPDREAHEMIVDGQRVGRTQLESAVLHYLMERAGKAVSRGDLLDDVWGYRYDGGSNVVDVVSRSIRLKTDARMADHRLYSTHCSTTSKGSED